MKNTAAIRKQNINHIRQIIAGGGEHTVKSLIGLTGMCAATCNSILKYLVSRGEVVGTPCQMNEVGRCTMVYKMNPECASVMCVRCATENGRNFVHVAVLYLFGALRAFDDIECDGFSMETLINIINAKKEQYTGLNCVLLGIPEGDAEELSRCIEKSTGVQIKAMLNAEYFAYGVWIMRKKPGEVAVIALPQDADWKVYVTQNGGIISGLNGEKRGAQVNEDGVVAALGSACALVSPDRVCVVNATDKLRNEIKSGVCGQNCEIFFEDDFNFRCVGGMNAYARYIVFNFDDI